MTTRPVYTFCPVCAARLEAITLEGSERAACPAPGCGFVHYDNPTPVVAVIVERDGVVILARNHSWPEKMFSTITGFVERGEHPADTAVREVREELGLEASAPTLIGIYPFVPFNQLLIAYHVTATGEIVLGDELAAFREIPIAKLRPWSLGPGPAIADWLARRAAAPEG